MPLQIIRQDIVKMKVDAIVNTTNEEKVGYSGLDLAIHTVAGPRLDEECASLPPLAFGKAQITSAYNLPAKYVIHTAGPVWCGGGFGEEETLRSCYLESLRLAVEHGCRTVAFPLISAGVYRFSKDKVLKFAIQTITDFLFEHELTVYICVFDSESYSFSRKLFEEIKSYIDDDYVATHTEDYYDDVCSDIRALEECLCKESEETYSVSASFAMPTGAGGKSLEEYVSERDVSFREMLFDLIDRSGMTDVECYKRANVDKRTFSKIKGKKDYRPSKQTVIAFAVSLRLSLEETQTLLATVGFTLSRSTVFDTIILYFIDRGNYDIFEINEALFEFDQTLLGSFG